MSSMVHDPQCIKPYVLKLCKCGSNVVCRTCRWGSGGTCRCATHPPDRSDLNGFTTPRYT